MRRFPFWRILLLFFSFFPELFGGNSHPSEKIKLVLANTDLPAYRQVFAESYRSINRHTEKYEFTLKSFPLKRSHKVANEGLVDGIAARAESLSTENDLQNLVKVPTPIFYANSVLVLHVDSPDISSIKSLNGKKVAYINGAIHSMNLIPKDSRFVVNSHPSVLSMVVSKRVSAGSLFDLAYYSAIGEFRELTSQTKISSFSQRVPCFMFLHKRHQALIQDVDAVIQKALASGETQRAYDRTIDELKKPAKE